MKKTAIADMPPEQAADELLDMENEGIKSPVPETPKKATFWDWLAWLGLVGFSILFFFVIFYKMRLDGMTIRSHEDYSGWLVLAAGVFTAVILLIVSPFGGYLTDWVKWNKETGITSAQVCKITNFLILFCVIVQLLLLLLGVIDLLVAKKILVGLVIFSSVRNLLMKRGSFLTNLLLSLIGVMQFL